MTVKLNRSPRVSVVIPAYNSDSFISRAIDSVLSQTYEDYEIIVVDDGSVDFTQDVVSRYCERVKYIKQENMGAGAARNRAVQGSKGEYIAFLDADDAWGPEKLEKQVAFLDDFPGYVMVYSDMSHFEDDIKINDSYLHERDYKWVASGRIFMNLLRECFIFTPTVMVRKCCFNSVGGFDVSLKTCQDVDLWIRISSKNNIGYIDEPLALRYAHSMNSTKNADNYLHYPIVMFLKVYETHTDSVVRGIVKARLGELYFNLGYHQFRSNRFAASRASMMKGVRYSSHVTSNLKYIVLSLFPQRAVDVMREIGSNRLGRRS